MSRLTLALITASLLVSASAAHAAFTPEKCLAGKAKAWGKLRNCQRVEDAKRLQGKPSDPAKCETKFQEKLAKLNDQATEAAIACRYGDNGDGTVTDYDTGLQWEKKGGVVAGLCLVGDVHCVNDTYDWDEANGFVDASTNGSALTTCFSGHCDWRLPKIVELQTILLEPEPCGTSPCIDPIFGPTAANFYWSSTTVAYNPIDAWAVDFNDGVVSTPPKEGYNFYVRVVRGGL